MSSLILRLGLLSAITFSLLAAPAARQALEPVVEDAVSDRYRPESSQHQKISGLLANRMRANLEGRLLHVDEKTLIEGFQNRPGKQEWIGEHAGKFLDAAVKTYEYSEDRRLKELMDRIAKELIAAQKPDGYLGTYTDDQRWTSWDVWTHKYDLLGLLAYYRLTGDEAAFTACKKIGNLLVATFGDTPGKRDILKSGEHVGMAATSVLEPMVYLYRYTGDPRYLDFCKYIVRVWDEPGGPKIITTINSTGSVFKTANAKAYEMLSNLLGLVELYRVTGDESYFKPAVIAWKDVRDKRLYLTGTSSSGEHFRADYELPANEEDKVGEGCVTVTWMQLTLDLLRLTGETQYADQLERTVYNQLLGAQDARTGNICYFTPMNGRKNATPGVNCCVSSEPRGIALIPQTIWGRYDRGIAVILYTGGHAEFALRRRGMVRLYSETSYPDDGEVLLHVEPDHNLQFPLRLRVPEWTNSFSVDIDGSHLLGTPGQFLTLNREWKRGDTVKIKMDMTVRVVSGAPTYPGEVAIQRGPQVLAIEQKMNPQITNLLAAGPVSTNPTDLKLEDASASLPATWAGEQAYKIAGQFDGKQTNLLMVPFADARTYRVWLKKPETTSTAVH